MDERCGWCDNKPEKSLTYDYSYDLWICEDCEEDKTLFDIAVNKE